MPPQQHLGPSLSDPTRDQTIETLSGASRDHFPPFSGAPRDSGYSDQWKAWSSVSAAKPSTGARISWPPSPMVEDEIVSMAKERNPAQSDSSDTDSTPSRGSIDQRPILFDASEGLAAGPTSTTTSTARTSPESSPTVSRRSVKFSEIDQVRVFKKVSDASKAPGSDHTEAGRRDDVRNVSSRTACPRPEEAKSQPRWSDMTKEAREASLSNALRGAGRPRGSHPAHQAKTARVPQGLNISLQGSYSANHSPVSTPPSRINGADYFSTSRSSRPEPPNASQLKMPPSPPRSPRLSSNSTTSPATSRQASVTNSKTNSRASSPNRVPVPRSSVQVSHRPTTTLGSGSDSQTPKASKLGLSLSIPESSSSKPLRETAVESSRHVSNPLPYPVEDTHGMPSEERHISNLGLQAPPTPAVPAHRSSRYGDGSANDFVHRNFLGVDRPAVVSRHSHDGSLDHFNTFNVREDGPLRNGRSRGDDTSTKFSNPPRCPRSEAHRGHDDWYTLHSMPSLNICPDCFNATFVDTVFEESFRKALRDRNAKLKCDFSSSWMRLAWRITHLEQRRSLSLLEALARLQNARVICPGDKDSSIDWYAVYDHRGRQLKYFDVCPSDVCKIEILMPTLAPIFEPSDRSRGQRRRCDLREKSPRIETYLEQLFHVYEKGYSKRRKPDVDQFVEFCRRKMEIPECEKGKPIERGHWYSIPGLDEFSVCEDCHHSIIAPARETKSGIASRFIKTHKHAVNSKHRDGHKEEAWGPNCQLWSPRMRRVFKRADERNDYEYLRQRAVERKQVEDGHLMRRSALAKDLRREEGLSTESAERISKLEDAMHEEDNYWKKWQ